MILMPPWLEILLYIAIGIVSLGFSSGAMPLLIAQWMAAAFK
jgi:hypothetical protein